MEEEVIRKKAIRKIDSTVAIRKRPPDGRTDADV